MYAVRLADSKQVLALRNTMSGAAAVAKKRALTCPAKLEVVEVLPDTTKGKRKE
jgi:hypothetical protein